ncbi:shikimate dehydrogenase [Pseudarthrobacter sp. H3Y2-7]|uniref:shikimate dehydrogenase n=1 Tax=Pseudarthrobacter naphthalenicus TaxID=3031328 RepID=UPI0023AFFFB7|nr:shikimate dehydrogenase [Pseudarthrobacter sp. H3Y2-7]MDE8668907.1 shikimate dehydrogenase [Pseudarthrobacter sp. H3Y2-7]
MSHRAAVLGHPISHSKSPALHLAAYGRLGLDIAYTAVDLTEQALPAFMEQVRQQDGWRGLSVTMPLKTGMVAEVDEVRGVARTLGVVNTVAFEESGGSVRRVGYNTDVAGIVNAVRYAGALPSPSAVVLGGGGTAAAAVAALKDLGTGHAQVFVRDPSRATEALAAAAGVGVSIDVRPMTEAAAPTARADVVISTLPPRAADNLVVSIAALGSGTPGVLLDVAYDPWPSRIAAVWQAGGGTVVPGLEMLLYQAVEQVRLFTGRGDDVNAAVIDVMCDSVGLPRRAF